VDLRRRVVPELRARASPAVAAQARTYFKNPPEMLGVRAGELRRIARAAAARLDGALGPEAILDACEPLVRDRRFEVNAVGLLVCERLLPRIGARILPRARRWLECGWCDSWAAVDTLCQGATGPLLLREPSLAPRVVPWTRGRSMWLRRAAAVSFVKPARKGLLLDEAYAVAERLLLETEDLLHKAVGWLLREAGTTDAARLERFLLDRGPAVPRTALRYAIERFPPARRTRLLAATRRERRKC